MTTQQITLLPLDKPIDWIVINEAHKPDDIHLRSLN